MPSREYLTASSERLRALADRLEAEGDLALAEAARQAADEVDAAPPPEPRPPEA